MFAEVDVQFLHNVNQVVMVQLRLISVPGSKTDRLLPPRAFLFLELNAELSRTLDDVKELAEGQVKQQHYNRKRMKK